MVAMDYEAFRTCALDMMIRGYPRHNLNRLMKVNIFDEGKDSLYYFEADGLVDIETARQMPAHQFAILLLNAVLQAAQSQAHYGNKATFDQQVFQKYVALMFFHYATSDPMFYAW